MKRAAVCALAVILLMMGGCSGPEVSSDIAEFKFSHRGSSTEACYTYHALAADNGVEIALEKNAGNDIIKTEADADVLMELRAIVETYGINKWDGFDKKSRRALDGTGFTLYIRFEDGTEINAAGSTKFPKQYAEAKEAICVVFEGLTSN